MGKYIEFVNVIVISREELYREYKLPIAIEWRGIIVNNMFEKYKSSDKIIREKVFYKGIEEVTHR